MLYLNLDKDFNPYNATKKDNTAASLISWRGVSKDSTTFPSGEPQFKLVDRMFKLGATGLSALDAVITTRIRSFNDLGLLLAAVDVLRNNFCEKIGLVLPYFPGGRQDRRSSPREPLTVKIYTDIINSMGFEFVKIFDAHSDVTTALLNKVFNTKNHWYALEALTDINNFNMLIPDSGARKRCNSLANFLRKNGKNFEIVQCEEIRNPLNGRFAGYEVNSNDLQGKPCVIIDDICDNDRQFIGIAKRAQERNAGTQHLIVSHGIFSKGTIELNKYFDSITSTDSFYSEVEGVKIINLNEQLL